MTVVALANKKGGVGKTTMTIELASGFAIAGKKVLMIDFDPQCSLTNAMIKGSWSDYSQYNIGDVIFGEINKEKRNERGRKISLLEAGIQTQVPNLHLIGGSTDLKLMEKMSPTTALALKKRIEEIKEQYDYIFIDTPPYDGTVQESALIATEYVILVYQAKAMGLEGLQETADTIENIKEEANPDLKILGTILNQYKSRTDLAKEAKAFLQQHTELIAEVFEQSIGDYTAIERNPIEKLPVTMSHPSSTAAEQVRLLTKEIMKKLKFAEKKAKTNGNLKKGAKV
jgi:chromosome partitioning protein